jgi:hypothetical protein
MSQIKRWLPREPLEKDDSLINILKKLPEIESIQVLQLKVPYCNRNQILKASV